MSLSATAAAPIPLDSLAWNSSSNHHERSTLSHGKVPGFFQSCASQIQLSIYHTRDLTQLSLLSLVGAESLARIDEPRVSCHVICASRERGRGGWAEKACLRLVILKVALRPSNYLLALVIVSMNK